jgi:hypothetical protein
MTGQADASDAPKETEINWNCRGRRWDGLRSFRVEDAYRELADRKSFWK